MIKINRASNIHRTVFVLEIVCLLTCFASVIFVAARNDNGESTPNIVAPSSDAPARARIAENFGRLPLSFEVNKGQTDQSVKFLSRGSGYELFLTSTDAVLRLRKPQAVRTDSPQISAPTKSEPGPEVREGSVLRLRMIGANATPRVEGQEELPGKMNYFIGNNPEKWFRNVPTYRKAYYTDVYPGIDMVYYGNQRQLEYDFVVGPGANPKLIRFRVEGADRIRLDKAGSLVLTLPQGEVQLRKPLIYQLDEQGGRREVKSAYVINGSEIRFAVQDFDSAKPLVIDPVISYATFLGGGANDSATSIAVDSQGNAYVTGRTDNVGFPTTVGAFKTTNQNGGAFVTKLDSTGSSLIYSTLMTGGNGSSNGTSIAVDSAGNAHITGSTSSAADFPTVNPLKTTSNFFKSTDAAASWNNLNTGLTGSTASIAVAPNAPNTLYAGSFTGIHRSTDTGLTWTKTLSTGLQFPFALSLAVDPTNSSVVYAGIQNGGLYKSTDAGNSWSQIATTPLSFAVVFSIVFDPTTPSTMYVGSGGGAFKSLDGGSTWIAINNFGLSFSPSVRAIAIDPTSPTTIYAGTFGSGFFKSINGGASWSAMNSGMGGSSATSITAVVIDPSNPSTIYTGHGSTGGVNKSTNAATSWAPVNSGLPTLQVNSMVATSSAVYAATDAGVVKTTNGGTSWTSANLGFGSPQVRVLVGHPGDSSTLYAGTNTPFSTDAFVTKLNATGSALLFSTILGGNGDESGNGIALDSTGHIYVVGQTRSLNFPVVNAVQSSVSDNCFNGFVTKINPSLPSYAFSTYLGGNGCDVANGVATDAADNVYVTGNTGSTDFPIANAFQSTNNNSDAFVTKLTSTGSLSYSTFLGGNGTDTGYAIAVDVSGSAYVTGSTSSSNFPTLNPIQGGPSFGDFNGDVFVTKFNAAGTSLVYSTYLRGGFTDIGRGIAIDSTGNAYLTGVTSSPEFPLTAGALRTKSNIFKSIDGGANWTNDNYGETSGGLAIAVHPTQPSTIFADGLGVIRSTNGGRNWSRTNSGMGSTSIRALLIDPLTPSTIYALASSGTGGVAGVFKSTDGGNTWNLRTAGMPSNNVGSLAIDPVTPNILYAGFGFLSGGGSHIYKTTDGANNWAPVGNAAITLPAALVVDPFTHTTIYAADSSSTGGVFRSLDSGVSWQLVGAGQTGPSAESVVASPVTPGLLYARIPNVGTFKSVDGGDNWSAVTLPRPGKIVFDPINAATIYILTEFDGVFKTTNNGQTWKAINKGLNNLSPGTLAVSPAQPSTLHLVLRFTGGPEAFVTKINSAGTALVYSTFIGGDTGSTEGSGIAIDSGGSVYIAGMASAEVFPTTPTAFQPLMRGGNDAFIAKLVNSYIISGRVLEGGVTPIGGAEVVLSDGSSVTSVFTEGDGSYEFARLREGGTFTVSAAKAHFTMTPPSQTFNNLSSNQVLDFTANATGAPFHIISGQVTESGVGLADVTVTLSGSQSGLRTTNSGGNYSFELPAGGNYTVTPSLLGFTFGPTSQTFNNLSVAQTANFAATRQNFVVTNTNNQGVGSLREAIINANSTVGLDTITFNIPGPGVKIISLMNRLPEITDPVVIDASTQPGYAGTPLVEIDGIAISNSHGMVIRASGTTVRGLAIGNFNSGILITDCNNNVIQGNHIGLDGTGSIARPNQRGMMLLNSSNTLIGGTTATARNVISGNRTNGLEILGIGSGNVVQGNFIGTNAAGTSAIANTFSGVDIDSATVTDNLIGGTASGAGNLISGNSTGIKADSTGNTIQGNLIGTDVTGTKKVPNSTGIEVRLANTLIGGTTPGARNVISGNSFDGVVIAGVGSKVQSNYIGTDITGTLPLGNGFSGVVAGDNALIGGTTPEERNIISANASNTSGNVSLGGTSVGSAATVQGNYIGTDVTGTRALGDSFSGIWISGGGNGIVGGTVPGARNVISGNRNGIIIGSTSGGSTGNVIQGNYIGLNAQGTGALPNTQGGIQLGAFFSPTNNTIGGTQSGAANTIAFNGGPGIAVISGTGNSLRGNSIFSNFGLGIDLVRASFSTPDGVTPNDVNDPDAGGNNLQNFPLITSVLSMGGSTTIQGSLNSIPATTFQIDFYTNAALDPSGNGEGAQFFNTTSVTTDNNGNATINVTFPAALPAGRIITATATDPAGNTSEFSAGDPAGANGSVQFSVASMRVIEDLSLLTITVLRSGGSAGTLTVNYATADGTALAGQDYTSTSGVLTFNGGETTKTFQIPITDDSTTEADETFTVALSNTATIDSLGAPSTLVVTLQDRSTVPVLSLPNSFMAEGGPFGTSSEMFMAVDLSAATGRTVTANFATTNGSAFGGTGCTRGVDYITKSGTVTVPAGATSVTIPITVCGDSSAEANETFAFTLSNPVNATLLNSQASGSIVNDDVMQLILEELGPANQAAALDAVLQTRDPFRILTDMTWLPNLNDHNTRVALFVRNLELNPGESPAFVTVRIFGIGSQFFDVPAEDVRSIHDFEFTQVVFRLPNNLPVGTRTVTIRAHGRVSNGGTIRIIP